MPDYVFANTDPSRFRSRTMPRASFVPLLALSIASLAPTTYIGAQTGLPPSANGYDLQRYTANQLDNLVGPIALYPDALLAQVLVAATFPDQVEDAARWVRENGTAGIDDQAWDVSVKSVAHYPSALNTMADKNDWTATLGRAYASQSSDVMAAVQRMRSMADGQGNLVSNQQQQVVRDNDSYVIVPAQPRVIYVPVYDPVVIYTRPVFGVGFSSRYWSYGVGFPIGGWLAYDCDWRTRAVYYNGWNDAYFGYGGGWRGRSRPFVQITNVYVNPRYRNVFINRNVMRFAVNYRNVDRYAGVHRDVYFDRNGRDNGRNDRNGRGDSRDGRNDGRDNGRDGRNDRDRGFPYGSDLGRSAQPRNDRPAATPDGYRTGSNDRSNSGDRNRPQNPRSDNQPSLDRRRNEPSGRAAEMSVSPEAVRAARADRGNGNGGNSGRGERAAPSADQQSAPRPEREREARPQSEQRGAQPRQAQPRDNGGERRPPDRSERSANDRDRGGRDRRGG